MSTNQDFPAVASPSQSSSPAPFVTPNFGDEAYLKVLEFQQEKAKGRWSVATFFMSVSFAVFGFSFQVKHGNRCKLGAQDSSCIDLLVCVYHLSPSATVRQLDLRLSVHVRRNKANNSFDAALLQAIEGT